MNLETSNRQTLTALCRAHTSAKATDPEQIIIIIIILLLKHTGVMGYRMLFLSIISTAYHLLSGSRAARLLLNWLIDWLI